MRSKTCLALGLSLAFFGAKPASATFHEIMVKEVFGGTPAAPNAQYVVLQAWAQFQNAVGGHTLTVYNAAGASVGTFTFPGPVGNGADQMTLYIATAEAATLFNLTADLAMTPVIAPAGGKVCWETWDCFAWGNYSGSATGVGTPYNATGGLLPGYAARRRLDICLQIETLNACDDTGDSANDFFTAIPDPVKNSGVHGTTPPATCGNNVLEGLEGCDDNNTNDGDGCSAICRLEPAPLAPAGLKVDVTALVPGTSNVNGVFEPGEAVRIEPSWSNGGGGDAAVTGQVANFTSALAGRYMIFDGAADYGTIAPAGTAECGTGSDCYRLFADAPTRPAQHWDSTVDEILSNGGVRTWTLHLGNSFVDVPSDNPAPHPFYAFIENLFHNGVTGGVSGGNYGPANPVTRAQMAVFLLKAKYGSAHVPPACTGTVFTDVPCTGGGFDPWIEELSSLGITGGCGGGLYCPNNPVTRQQMAVFLLKAKEGSAYDPPDCAGIFDDVACTPGTGFSDWIEELYSRQITGGCAVSPLMYCPTSPNNRGQMAVFLVKTFSLVLYGPS